MKEGDGNESTREKEREEGLLKRRWLDKVRGDIKEKGLSGENMYDRAAWRRMSSYIDPHLQKCKFDEDDDEEVTAWLLLTKKGATVCHKEDEKLKARLRGHSYHA